MSKGIKGEDIDIVKRLDDKRIIVYLKDNKGAIVFKAAMVDYDDCSLMSEHTNARRK